MLSLVILLQQGRGGDIASAFGGSSSQAAFGARSGATLLTKATSIAAVLFMILALALSIIGQRGTSPSSAARQRRLPRRSLRRCRRRGPPRRRQPHQHPRPQNSAAILSISVLTVFQGGDAANSKFMVSRVTVAQVFILVTLFTPSPAQAQASAAQPARATSIIAGCVTDPNGQPMPGVALDIGQRGRHLLAHTDATGCYAVTDVEPGYYFVFARLLGFVSATRDNVIAEADRSQTVNFRMRVAPICECLAFPTTLIALWNRADTVVRVRLTGHDANAPDAKHIGTLLKVWKGYSTLKSGEMLTFLQRPEGNEIEPYAVDQEFVLFLQWSPQEQAFVRLSSGDGTVGAFAIEGGRVHSAPITRYRGVEDGQLVKELMSLAGR